MFIDLLPSREVAISLLGFSIHWYAIMYVAAFWVGFALLPRLSRYRGMILSGDDSAFLVAWVAVGVLFGGRLGYVLFYEPSYFLQHPAEVFALWKGGMASHGGFLGAGVALWYVKRRWKQSLLALLDIVVIPIATGLSLGRFGNFINQELYPGSAALVIAGVLLVTAGICFIVLRSQTLPGRVGSLFLLLYAVQRIVFEPLRIDSWEGSFGLTYGQFLTLPILLIGVWLWYATGRNKNHRAPENE